MASSQKDVKSKLVYNDLYELINKSDCLKNPPKSKNPQKRNRKNDEGISSTFGQLNAKISKNDLGDTNIEACRESRQKLLKVMNKQLESRKESGTNLLKSLSEIYTSLEADHNALKENEEQFQQLTEAFMKCIHQTTLAHKQNLKSIKNILDLFQKECQELDSAHKAESDQLGQELEEDIKNLQQKLVSETKRNGWETLKRTICQAMQNDF